MTFEELEKWCVENGIRIIRENKGQLLLHAVLPNRYEIKASYTNTSDEFAYKEFKQDLIISLAIPNYQEK